MLAWAQSMERPSSSPQELRDSNTTRSWRSSRIIYFTWLDTTCLYLRQIVRAYVSTGHEHPNLFNRILEQLERDVQGGELPRSPNALHWDGELQEAISAATLLLARTRVIPASEAANWD